MTMNLNFNQSSKKDKFIPVYKVSLMADFFFHIGTYTNTSFTIILYTFWYLFYLLYALMLKDLDNQQKPHKVPGPPSSFSREGTCIIYITAEGIIGHHPTHCCQVWFV